MSRGGHGEVIFRDDRCRFLETFAEGCEKTGWRTHADVLMPNPYHLLLETPEANLVGGMKWFQGTSTQRRGQRSESLDGEAVQAGKRGEAEVELGKALKILGWEAKQVMEGAKGSAPKQLLAGWVEKPHRGGKTVDGGTVKNGVRNSGYLGDRFGEKGTRRRVGPMAKTT